MSHCRMTNAFETWRSNWCKMNMSWPVLWRHEHQLCNILNRTHVDKCIKGMNENEYLPQKKTKMKLKPVKHIHTFYSCNILLASSSSHNPTLHYYQYHFTMESPLKKNALSVPTTPKLNCSSPITITISKPNFQQDEIHN